MFSLARMEDVACARSLLRLPALRVRPGGAGIAQVSAAALGCLYSLSITAVSGTARVSSYTWYQGRVLATRFLSGSMPIRAARRWQTWRQTHTHTLRVAACRLLPWRCTCGWRRAFGTISARAGNGAARTAAGRVSWRACEHRETSLFRRGGNRRRQAGSTGESAAHRTVTPP